MHTVVTGITKQGLRAGLLVLGTALITAFGTQVSHAADMTSGFGIHDASGSLEDTIGGLENAIINQGLVIDYTGHVGDMLTRTAGSVEMKSPYTDAVYMQFCSAKHTHAVVAADPRNIAVCPYVVFAYEAKDGSGVKVGYRRPVGVDSPASTEALAGIDELLETIVKEAAEGF